LLCLYVCPAFGNFVIIDIELYRSVHVEFCFGQAGSHSTNTIMQPKQKHGVTRQIRTRETKCDHSETIDAAEGVREATTVTGTRALLAEIAPIYTVSAEFELFRSAREMINHDGRVSRSNGGAGKYPSSDARMSSTQRGKRSVNFSPEVSVFAESVADENTTIATQELADADEDMSPRSLVSGRWIEDTKESAECRGTVVVEVADHSPVLKSCSDSQRFQADTADSSRASAKSKLTGMRKRLLERHESPTKSNGNHNSPELTKSEETVSLLTPEKVNGTVSSSGALPMNSLPIKPLASPVGRTYDLKLINTIELHDDARNNLLSPG